MTIYLSISGSVGPLDRVALAALTGSEERAVKMKEVLLYSPLPSVSFLASQFSFWNLDDFWLN